MIIRVISDAKAPRCGRKRGLVKTGEEVLLWDRVKREQTGNKIQFCSSKSVEAGATKKEAETGIRGVGSENKRIQP